MLLIGTSIRLWKEPSEGKLVFAFIIACLFSAVMLFLSGMRKVAFKGQKTARNIIPPFRMPALLANRAAYMLICRQPF